MPAAAPAMFWQKENPRIVHNPSRMLRTEIMLVAAKDFLLCISNLSMT